MDRKTAETFIAKVFYFKKTLPYILVKKPAHPETRSERDFSVIFILMLFPKKPEGSRGHIREEQATTTVKNICNLFRQNKKKLHD